jgi:glyoxylase-like metal-dependent hydrolase (beta-lactamase superfamily II)
MQREIRVADGFWVFPLRTPTLPPATATNTAVVGKQRLVVIEPATPHADEQAALLEWLDARIAQGARVEAILLTHHHSDHIGFADGLRQRTGAPVVAHPETAARVRLSIDRHWADDTELALGDGYAIRPVFTPGHAPGHLCFHELRTGVVYAGDRVAGEGTILIDPDDGGNMTDYLASLERIVALEPSRLVPAHGRTFEEPEAVCRHYVEHRLGRERKVVDAMGTESKTLPEILASAYADTPKMLWPLAEKSLRAHLEKLEADGRVHRDETGARLVVA